MGLGPLAGWFLSLEMDMDVDGGVEMWCMLYNLRAIPSYFMYYIIDLEGLKGR